MLFDEPGAAQGVGIGALLSQELHKEQELVLSAEPGVGQGTGIGAVLSQGLRKEELMLSAEPGTGIGSLCLPQAPHPQIHTGRGHVAPQAAVTADAQPLLPVPLEKTPPWGGRTLISHPKQLSRASLCQSSSQGPGRAVTCVLPELQTAVSQSWVTHSPRLIQRLRQLRHSILSTLSWFQAGLGKQRGSLLHSPGLWGSWRAACPSQTPSICTLTGFSIPPQLMIHPNPNEVTFL